MVKKKFIKKTEPFLDGGWGVIPILAGLMGSVMYFFSTIPSQFTRDDFLKNLGMATIVFIGVAICFVIIGFFVYLCVREVWYEEKK